MKNFNFYKYYKSLKLQIMISHLNIDSKLARKTKQYIAMANIKIFKKNKSTKT